MILFKHFHSSPSSEPASKKTTSLKDVDKLPSDSLHFERSFDFRHNFKTDTDPPYSPVSGFLPFSASCSRLHLCDLPLIWFVLSSKQNRHLYKKPALFWTGPMSICRNGRSCVFCAGTPPLLPLSYRPAPMCAVPSCGYRSARPSPSHFSPMPC